MTFVALQAGTNADVTVTASSTRVFNAWIDFNADGDWDDGGEQFFVDQALIGGANNLTVSVPSSATVGATFARIRVTGTPGYFYFGLAPDGEVEDYRVTITAASSSSLLGSPTGLANLWAETFIERVNRTKPQSEITQQRPVQSVVTQSGSAVPVIADAVALEALSSDRWPLATDRHSFLDEDLVDQAISDEEILLPGSVLGIIVL